MDSQMLLNEMKELISLYRQSIGQSVDYLNKKSVTEPGFQSGPTKGYLSKSDNVTYWFHGMSCDININGLVVLINFGMFDRCDFFNPIDILAFLNSNKQTVKNRYPFAELTFIKRTMHVLAEDGFLVKTDLDNYGEVFLLPEDYHATEHLRWIDQSDSEDITASK